MAGHRVGSGAVTHIRLWIALPAMILVHLVVLGRFVPVGLPGSVWFLLGLSGFTGFFLADILIFRAFVDLGHRETLVVLTLSPLFAALLSRLALGETLLPIQIIGMVVTLSGVAWLIAAEHRSSSEGRKLTVGALFALAGAIAQAAGMVLAKQGLTFTGAVHPVSANLIRLISGWAGITLFRFVVRRGRTDFASMRDRKALALIAQGAIVGPVLGIVSNLYALTLASVGVVTTIMQTSPVLLLPVDRFVFKRRIPIGAYLGTATAVVGAMLLFAS